MGEGGGGGCRVALFSPVISLSLSVIFYVSDCYLSIYLPYYCTSFALDMHRRRRKYQENTKTQQNTSAGTVTASHVAALSLGLLSGHSWALSLGLSRGTSGHWRPSASEALALQHAVRTSPRTGGASSWTETKTNETKRLGRTQDFWSIEGFSLSTPPSLQTQTLPPLPSPCTLHMILQHATPSCIATGIVDSGFPGRLITPSGASPALRRASCKKGTTVSSPGQPPAEPCGCQALCRCHLFHWKQQLSAAAAASAAATQHGHAAATSCRSLRRWLLAPPAALTAAFSTPSAALAPAPAHATTAALAVVLPAEVSACSPAVVGPSLPPTPLPPLRARALRPSCHNDSRVPASSASLRFQLRRLYFACGGFGPRVLGRGSLAGHARTKGTEGERELPEGGKEISPRRSAGQER